MFLRCVEGSRTHFPVKQKSGDTKFDTFFNTLGKKLEKFHPVKKGVATIFTCGPSVYQRAHIGNFRTFLFEECPRTIPCYSGYTVKRGMNFTDIEDKAISEAAKKKIPVDRLTENNIREFMRR